MESKWEFIKNVDAWLQAEREKAQEAMGETNANTNAHVDSGLNILGINNSMRSTTPLVLLASRQYQFDVPHSGAHRLQPVPTARARLCAPGVLRRPPTWLDQLSPPPWSNTRRTTLGPAKDADNAMWSDDKSDDEGTPGIPQPSYARRAIVPPPMTSLISKMVSESTSRSTATMRPHEDGVRVTAARSYRAYTRPSRTAASRQYQFDVSHSGVQWQVASRGIGHQSFFCSIISYLTGQVGPFEGHRTAIQRIQRADTIPPHPGIRKHLHLCRRISDAQCPEQPYRLRHGRE
jgi:hypothetical protein